MQTGKKQWSLDTTNQTLKEFAKLVNGDKAARKVRKNEPLKVGVDLGTSSIVLTVLDQHDQPLYGAFEYAKVVRDGIVVDYIGSIQILKRLKAQAENVLGQTLTSACGAIPPGTGENSANVVANVIEATEMEAKEIVDEPTAAAKFLRLTTGTVVDIGGGTTGISVFKQKRLVKVVDEPTGGSHMTLVLAGYHHIPADDAELMKRDPKKDSANFPIIRPVVEKMATITKNVMATQLAEPVIVVGGATNFKDFVKAFSHTLGRSALKPAFPQFVTPLGIAMYDK
ncbi:ethanolamine utilization protein EutJ [Loigolactobacillus jiayinensis]|uniref:Ethanolamine utilization protein EutJ n=1 Tax=Loigolactobacillus jiayinensis TaxID=2486016 RepID=A0ABW1REG4_9LACO|nr:ethanolamine utilization protein EutJ [Loigolactobacillus jiayinensis]